MDLIEFVRRCTPRLVVGVHDGLLNEAGLTVADRVLPSLPREGAGAVVRPAVGDILPISGTA